MKKIILWGQPLINRVVKKGAPIVATHNVTEPPPPIHIVSIDRIVTGTCEYPQSGTCVATSQYEVMGTEFTPPVTLVWSVSAGATITAGQGTKIITVTTDSNTNTTYDVTCVATDISGSDTKTETFTDVRTMEPPITITSITRTGGGSCEYPSAGVCASTSNFTVAYTNATGTVTYNWVITGQAALQSGQGTQNITVLTDQSNTNITYNVSCTVTDSNSTDTEVQPFTDTRTQEPLVGETWTIRTTPTASSSLRTVCFGNGKYVTAGTASTALYSTNGINWTSQAIASNDWTSIAYGAGVYAMVNAGTGTAVLTSPDAITWTSRTGQAGEWRGLCFGNNLFVAVGNSPTNQIMTSPDGINWTVRTSPNTNSYRAVTYGNGLFVAVASSGTGNRVMTSPDGINWTPQTSSADNFWAGIAYGNNLFVAISSTGVMTSPNGINWTNRTSAVNNNWQSITYTGTLFVAVSDGGTNRVMTSPDGITWTSRAAPAANMWRSVCYSPSLNQCVAISTDGGQNQVMTSP